MKATSESGTRNEKKTRARCSSACAQSGATTTAKQQQKSMRGRERKAGWPGSLLWRSAAQTWTAPSLEEGWKYSFRVAPSHDEERLKDRAEALASDARHMQSEACDETAGFLSLIHI